MRSIKGGFIMSAQMPNYYDPDGVSKEFKKNFKSMYDKAVAEIAKQGGDEKKIDTAEEMRALMELPQTLANQDGISRDEKGYIVEHSPQYLDETAEKALKKVSQTISPKAKDAVDKCKNDVTENSAFDNKAEAEKLIQQILDNGETHAWNLHEIEYFKMELIKAGYGDLLKEKLMQGTSAPVESKKETEEADAVPKNEQDGKGGVSAEPGEQAPADEPVGYNIPPEEPEEPPKKPIKEEPLPYDPLPWDEEPGPTSPAEPVTKYQISKDDELKGITTARNLLNEIDSTFYTDNATVASALKNVDDRNAYYFIGTFINDPSHEGLAVEVLGISDRFSITKLSFSNITPVIESLLNQAAELGLEQDEAYMQLKRKTDEIKTYTSKKKNYDGTKDEQRYVDKLIENLYNKMSEKIG